MHVINLMRADVSHSIGAFIEPVICANGVANLPRVSISRLQYLHRKAMHVGSTPDVGRIQIYSFRVTELPVLLTE